VKNLKDGGRKMTKSNLEIESIQEEIRQLENQKRKLLQQQKEQERKARTKRLIERGAILESLIDGVETLSNEQIKSLLAVALNSESAVKMQKELRERAGQV